MSASNRPQNVTDACWYYEDAGGIYVLITPPGGGDAITARIPWYRLAKSMKRARRVPKRKKS